MAKSNVSSVTKHFYEANEGFSTTLKTTVASGGSIVELNSTTDMVDGSVFVGIIEQGSVKEQVFTGTIDLTNARITGVVWTRGVNVEHTAGVSIIDYVTGTGQNMMSKGILVHANQDGSLKNQAVKDALGVTSDPTGGWQTQAYTPSTITNNGNHSTDLTFTGVDLTPTLSEGMRLRLTRTVAAPVQCATFDGTNDYFSKSSPAGMTFTDDFAVSAWVKLSSYASSGIVSRYNGTSGWILQLNSSGQVYLGGYNGSSGNLSQVVSYQSLPLNKWVHITAQLDMSAFTATTTTSYIMIDGVDVPASVSRTGTNPTALIQAGNLEIGTFNGGAFFPGKIAQVAIFNAKVTQATIKTSMNQGLTGSETSLVSAYSLSNSLEDLSANNNDLTANGGVLATTADSPFGNSGASTTLEYGIVMSKPVYSGGDTTMTVQTPEGCAIPTSGGISSVDYSSASVPFGFPRDSGKWSLYCKIRTALTNTSSATYIAFANNSISLTVPTGSWKIAFQFNGLYSNTATTIAASISPTSLVGLSSGSYSDLSFRTVSTGAVSYAIAASGQTFRNISTAENWVLYTIGAATSMGIDGTSTINELYAENAYL